MDEATDGVRRRDLLRLATAGTAGLAGCSGLLDSRPDGDGSADDAGESSPRGGDGGDAGPAGDEAEPPERPYEADLGPELADPGGVVVRNLASESVYLTLVVTDGDEEAFVESGTVPGSEALAFDDLLGTAGDYGVVVETAAGRRATYDWSVTPDLPDLLVDLTPTPSFHRPFHCVRDCGPLATVRTAPPASFPTSALPGSIRGRTPLVTVDNPTADRQTATLGVAEGLEELLAVDYDLPPNARALVPVASRRAVYRLALSTDAGETSREWRPQLDRRLHAVVGESPPVFRCGLMAHDLVVVNGSGDRRTVEVSVSAGDESLFEREFTVPDGGRTRVPSAIDPAGRLTFVIATDDGRRERYDWGFCAPRGPISVSVVESGINVAVSPDGSL
jgi:hypothetical protein